MGFFDFIGDIFEPSQKNSTTTGMGGSTSTTYANPNYQPYQNPLLNPRSEISDRADELTRSLAMGGSPTLGAANQYNQNVLGGKFLNANPYLDQTFNNAASRVGDQFRMATQPGIAASHNLMGRYNSGSQRNTESMARGSLGDTLNRLATDIYGGAYNTERGAMENAAGRAPSLNQADYYGSGQLARQGALRDSYFDQAATRNYGAWRDNQTLPYQYGQTTTGSQNASQTTPFYGPSPFETAVGIGSKFLPFFL